MKCSAAFYPCMLETHKNRITREGEKIVSSSEKKNTSWIEKVTKAIPDPFVLFFGLLAIVMALSVLLSKLGVSAVNPSTGEEVFVTNLFKVSYIGSFIADMGSTFISFSPMLTVPICALGIGVATHSGFLGSTLKLAGDSTKSKWLLTFIIAVVGCNGNLAGDVAMYIYPLLVALLFYGVGRNPIAGILLALASTSLGFCTCFITASGELILIGFTESAARVLEPDFTAGALMNWYFLAVSVFFVSAVLTVLCIKVVEPRLNRQGIATNIAEFEIGENGDVFLTDLERKGIKKAGIALLVFVAAVVVLALPNMPLGKTETVPFSQSNFFKAVAALISMLFFVGGYAYGKTVGTIKSFKDASMMMAKGIGDLGPFFVVSFAAAMFVKVFTDSNIANVIAIKGGIWLSGTGLSGIAMLVIFLIFTAFINIFFASAISKWALFAMIFVPMLMMNGLSPAAIHTAYRIGDGMTNAMSPLSAAVIVSLTYCAKFDKKFNLGSLFKELAPMTLGGGLLFILWYVVWSLLGIPYGPGFSYYMW